MLKFFFWLLLLANAALFAYQRGYLESVLPSGREPARLARQFNADKIKLISAPPAAEEEQTPPAESQPATAPTPGTPAATTASVAAVPAPGPVPAKSTVPTCIEIGNFTADEAKRFGAQLAVLALGPRLSQHPVQQAASHIVYIPPQGSKEGAEKKAGELRHLGVKDFFIIQNDSSLRWGISLGVFKQESTARAYLAGLNQKGVHSARVGEYGGTNSLVAFRLLGLDAKAKETLDKIKAGFPRQQTRVCGTP